MTSSSKPGQATGIDRSIASCRRVSVTSALMVARSSLASSNSSGTGTVTPSFLTRRFIRRGIGSALILAVRPLTHSGNVAKQIDPDLPFTEGEVRRALALVLPADQARDAAREIARLPAEATAQAEAAAAARLRGNTDPLAINPPQWQVGDELFALLACVSESLATRVDQYMEQRWQSLTRRYVEGEMLRRRLWGEAEPPAEILSIARRKVGHWKAGWTRLKRRFAREFSRTGEGGCNP